jgi:hypothetical protein
MGKRRKNGYGPPPKRPTPNRTWHGFEGLIAGINRGAFDGVMTTPVRVHADGNGVVLVGGFGDDQAHASSLHRELTALEREQE